MRHFVYSNHQKQSAHLRCLTKVSALAISGLTLAYGSMSSALTIDQVKISGLLLNTRNDPALTDTIGTGLPTILAYADTVNTTNIYVLSTSTPSSVPKTLTNGTVVDGVNTIAVKFDSPLNGVLAIGGRYKVRFALSGTGSPVFNSTADVSQMALIGSAGTCQITSGPFATNTTANPDPAVLEYYFTIDPSCTASVGPNQGPSFMAIDSPWRLKQVGDASVTVSLAQDSAGSGTYTTLNSGARILVQSVTPVEYNIGDAPAASQQIGPKMPTYFAFANLPATPYAAISTAAGTDTAIGSLKVGLKSLASNYAGLKGSGQTPVIFANLGNAALVPITASDVTSELTVTAMSGKWNAIVPTVQGLTRTALTTNTVTLAATGALPQQTNITLATTNDQSQTPASVYLPQSYLATLQVKLSTSLGQNNPSPVTNVPLETVYQEGLTFRIPWIGSSTSSNPGQIRIVNNDTTDPTGPLFFVVRAATPALAPSNGCLIKQSLAPAEEYILGPDQISQCVGAFKRGDIILAVRADTHDIIVKARISSAGNKFAEATVSPNTPAPGRYEFPWFGGSRASTPSIVRMSNINDIATGAVTLTLRNIIDGAQTGPLVCNTAKVAGLATIASQGELLINSALADQCFGAFRRGDLSAEISGSTLGLSARMRVTSGSGAAAAEQQLGNLPTDQTVNASTGGNVLIKAGWVGGSLAATPSILRLSNTAATPTGKVTLTLTNVVGGTTAAQQPCDGATLPDLWTIFPTGELILDTAKLTSCFGTFRRGDLSIIVNGPASGLTAKMRVISTATGIVTEQALGEKCVSVSGQNNSNCLIAAWYDGPASYSKSVLRLTNNAAVATGAVQIMLRNAIESSQPNGQICGSQKLPALSAIAPQGELVFDSVAAKTCFGDFRRGDLQITVDGLTTGLYPSMRLTSEDGTMVADQLIGVPVTGAAPNP